MATDAYGNYVAGLDSLAAPQTSEPCLVGRGHGAPDANTPHYFGFWIDLDTGDVYKNTAASPPPTWALLTLGGSGAGGLAGHGSPEAAQVAPPGTPYLDLDTYDLWMKATGSGDTGWVQLISS